MTAAPAHKKKPIPGAKPAAKAPAPERPKAEPLQKGDEELIRTSDFVSIRLKFAISNTTTKTSVKNAAGVKLVEFLEKGLVLETPPRTCAAGHSLLIEAVAHGLPGGDVRFHATAKVESVDRREGADGDTDEIKLTLTQFEEAEWKKFSGIYSSRQTEIEKFLEAAKG